jgi:hypothetical protein
MVISSAFLATPGRARVLSGWPPRESTQPRPKSTGTHLLAGAGAYPWLWQTQVADTPGSQIIAV